MAPPTCDEGERRKRLPRFPLLSKRRRHPKAHPDVYQYDVLPGTFRGQVIHILMSTIGVYQENARFSSFSEPGANRVYATLKESQVRLCCTFSDSRGIEGSYPSEVLLCRPTRICSFLNRGEQFKESAAEPHSPFQRDGEREMYR